MVRNPPSLIADVLHLRSRGVSYSRIAADLSITRCRVAGIVSRQRVGPPHRRGAPTSIWFPEKIEALRTLRAKGLTYAECGSILGCSKSAAQNAGWKYIDGNYKLSNVPTSGLWDRKLIERYVKWKARRVAERAQAVG